MSELQPAQDARSERRLGVALIVAAAVAWSTAPFFTRLLPFDPWTILFWRGLFGGMFIVVFLVAMRRARGLGDFVSMGKGGWLVAALSTTGMVTFIPALQMTDVTNVAVIIATQPFVAAALAYLWFREAARWQTMLASFMALCGIALIVSNAHGAADLRGIGLACIMVLAISAMTVAMRRYRETPMVAAAALSNFLGSAVSLPFAHDIAQLGQTDIFVAAMFGFCQVALGLTFYALGSRHLPSGEASLVATLETPLMPFWIWLAFSKVPSLRALAGGALVMGAVVADIVSGNRARARV